MATSIFSQEWRDCLRAHYTHVIRTDDKITERTLRGVMIHEAGFTEGDLKQLYVLATAHVDDVPADFVPDMEILGEEAPVSVAVAMPQEVIHALIVEEALQQDEIADAASGDVDAVFSETDALSGDVDMLVEDALDVADMSEPLADEDADDEAVDSSDDEPPLPAPDVTQLSLF